jgi:hypothetical protein
MFTLVIISNAFEYLISIYYQLLLLKFIVLGHRFRIWKNGPF